MSLYLLRCFLLLSLFQTLFSQFCSKYCGPNGCNCYEVFNIAKSASTSEIKKVYRALSFKYHPDVSLEKDANDRFVEIANCYEIFSDETSRADYNYCVEYGDYAHYGEYFESKAQQKKSKDSEKSWYLLISIFNAMTVIYSKNFKQGARKRKQSIKVLCYILVCLGVFLLFSLMVPSVNRPVLTILFQLSGQEVLLLIGLVFWASFLLCLIIRKVCYWTGIFSLEEYLRDFLLDLEEKVDTYQEKLTREANEKKKSKEDDLKLSEDREIANLERSQKKEDLLSLDKSEVALESKSQKETAAEKIYYRVLQLLKFRNNYERKEIDEDFEKSIESLKKTCDYYRSLLSETGENLKKNIQGKEISQRKLEQELENIKKDVETKMVKNWRVDSSI